MIFLCLRDYYVCFLYVRFETLEQVYSFSSTSWLNRIAVTISPVVCINCTLIVVSNSLSFFSHVVIRFFLHPWFLICVHWSCPPMVVSIVVCWVLIIILHGLICWVVSCLHHGHWRGCLWCLYVMIVFNFFVGVFMIHLASIVGVVLIVVVELLHLLVYDRGRLVCASMVIR